MSGFDPALCPQRIYVDLLPEDGQLRVVVTSEDGQVMIGMCVSPKAAFMPPGLRGLLTFPGFRVSALTLERVDGLKE